MNTNNKIYSFGSYQLDMSEYSLKRDNTVIPLPPKILETLLVLVENRERVISKDELMQTLWPDTFVEENNLTQNISQLRRALGNDASAVDYIKTVPKRGYKFIAEVSINTATNGSGVQEPQPIAQKLKLSNKSINATTVSIISLIVIVAAFLLLRSRLDNNAEKLLNNPQFIRLTDSGNILELALSNNGKYVAYAIEEGDKQSLHISQISGTNDLRITEPDNTNIIGITFSQDDQHIYYTANRENGNRFSVYRVSFLGGKSDPVISDVSGPVTFSPDGTQLAFIRFDAKNGEMGMIIANTSNYREKRLIYKKLPEKLIPDSISWSPDGKYIACGIYLAGAESKAHLVAIDPNDGKELVIGKAEDTKLSSISNIDWMNNSQTLIFTAWRNTSGVFGSPLWLASFPTGKLQRLTNENTNYFNVRASSDSKIIAAKRVDRVSRIWTGDLSASGVYSNNITESQTGFGFYLNHDSGLNWLNTDKLVFTSQKAGKLDIWVSDRSWKNQQQLTNNLNIDKYPIATSDGKYIVFVSDRSKHDNIWRMDSNGNNQIQLTHGIGESFPNITPDSKHVIYLSAINGQIALWKVSINGGKPEKISDKPLFHPVLSPDGKWIAAFSLVNYSYGNVVLIPVGGGEPRIISNINMPEYEIVRWSADSSALTYIQTKEGVSNIWSQPINAASPHQLTNFTSDRIFRYAISPDGKLLACERGVNISDVVIIK